MAGQMSSAVAAPKPDSPRGDGRDNGRDFVRVKPREPHQKYELPKDQRQPDMDYFWAATKIRGMPNPHFNDYWRSGWRPVSAKAAPDLSGLNLHPDQSLIDMGIVREIKPDDPILLDDLMLMMRPIRMSKQAEAEDHRRAEQQVSDHLRTQREKSNSAIGAKNTQIYRSYGPPDEVPSDSEVEMG